LVKVISTSQPLKKDLFRDKRFDQAKLRMKLKNRVISTKLTDTHQVFGYRRNK